MRSCARRDGGRTIAQRSSVVKARAFIGVIVGVFGWVVDSRHGPVAKLAANLLGLSGMVSIQIIWSMEIRANSASTVGESSKERTTFPVKG